MEDSFVNEINQKISIRKRLTEQSQQTKINVFIVHGLHEHSGYYDEFMTKLNEIGCNAFTLDLVGHGESEGPRGEINSSLDLFIKDIIKFADLIKNEYHGYTNVIFGYSMGGLVSVKLVLDYPTYFQGIIMEGPSFDAKWKPHLAIPVKCIAAMFPRMGVKKFNVNDLSHNQEYLEQKEEDPLNIRDGVKSCMANAIFNTMNNVRSRINQLELPILIIHGQEDKVCAVSGSTYIHENCLSRDKTLIIVPGAFHSVHHETEDIKKIFYDNVMNWLQSRFINKNKNKN